MPFFDGRCIEVSRRRNGRRLQRRRRLDGAELAPARLPRRRLAASVMGLRPRMRSMLHQAIDRRGRRAPPRSHSRRPGNRASMVQSPHAGSLQLSVAQQVILKFLQDGVDVNDGDRVLGP